LEKAPAYYQQSKDWLHVCIIIGYILPQLLVVGVFLEEFASPGVTENIQRVDEPQNMDVNFDRNLEPF
jgi:hypothetical protein